MKKKCDFDQKKKVRDFYRSTRTCVAPILTTLKRKPSFCRKIIFPSYILGFDFAETGANEKPNLVTKKKRLKNMSEHPQLKLAWAVVYGPSFAELF